jgi:hypothetical protein
MKNIYLNKFKKAGVRTMFFVTVALATNTASAQFTAGNISVLQVGDGASTLANTGNQIILKEFSPFGTPTFSVPVPITGTNALRNSGTATSEGALTLSSNGQHLIFGGYNTVTTPSTSISGASATLIPRGVGMVNAAGSFSLAATSNTFYSANNIRGAASDGAGNFWGAGANQGTNYFGNTNTPALIQNTITNTRSIYLNGSNLLFSTGSGTAGIYSTPNAFTSGGPVTPYLITAGTGTGTASPYAFYQNPGATVMYVADDRSSANGGGIQKFVNTGTWTYTYTIPTGTVGARGVIADFSNAIPVIYATTAEGAGNRIVVIGDIGAISTATTIVTSGTNTIFRGIAFSPTVACAAPSVSISTSNATLCSNFSQSATLTASGATSYSWSTGVVSPTIVVTPSTTTTYTAIGTNTCSSSSSTFTQVAVICGGVKSASINGSISIYPNPVKDVLNINIEEQGNYSITIIDAVGKVVYVNQTDKNLTINTSNLSQGIYIVKVKSNNTQSNYKFIKD